MTARPLPVPHAPTVRPKSSRAACGRRGQDEPPAAPAEPRGPLPGAGFRLPTVSRLGSPTLGELAAAELVQPPTNDEDGGDDGRRRLPAASLGPRRRAHLPGDGDRRRRADPRADQVLKNAFLSERLAELSEDERHQLHELLALLERMCVSRDAAARDRGTHLRGGVGPQLPALFHRPAAFVSGTWMQSVAQVLLVLDKLHGNGFDVGVVTALQFLPILLLGSFGGLVADRVDKRRLLFFTQGAAGLVALALAILTLAGTSSCGGLRPRHLPRSGQPVRQPGAPDLRLGDGGKGPAAQCGQPQQRGHELGRVIGPAIGAS